MYTQVKNFKEAEESIAKGLKRPFVKTLQVALSSFNVEKQAYYNHVLQVSSLIIRQYH